MNKTETTLITVLSVKENEFLSERCFTDKMNKHSVYTACDTGTGVTDQASIRTCYIYPKIELIPLHIYNFGFCGQGWI